MNRGAFIQSEKDTRPADETREVGGFLPLALSGYNRSPDGYGVPGIVQSLIDALTAPSRAYQGKIPEEKMPHEALNLAGLLAGGGARRPMSEGIRDAGIARVLEEQYAGKVPPDVMGNFHDQVWAKKMRFATDQNAMWSTPRHGANSNARIVSPVVEYQKTFGYPPPEGMSEEAMKRWILNRTPSFKEAPIRSGWLEPPHWPSSLGIGRDGDK
jgi:hypothetical protein